MACCHCYNYFHYHTKVEDFILSVNLFLVIPLGCHNTLFEIISRQPLYNVTYIVPPVCVIIVELGIYDLFDKLLHNKNSYFEAIDWWVL